MKKEFSFYEFTGILVPSVILLFTINFIINSKYSKIIFNFSEIGDSLIFIIVAYGFGHIIHSIGNLYERLIWKIFGGWPTNWLTKKPRLKQRLFDETDTASIKVKLFSFFEEVAEKDYGRNVYSILYQKKITGRIDIFNSNYSLFRALTSSFILLIIASAFINEYILTLVFSVIALLSHIRMIRFAKLYAREIFRNFLVMD